MHSDESQNRPFGFEVEKHALTPYREPLPLQPVTNGEIDYEEERSSLGIHDYWLMVRSRLWIILAITFLITTLVLVYVAQQPDVYEAQARIQVDLENNPALGSAKSGSVIINAPGDDPAYFNTQLLLLKSPAFLRRVVRTLNQEQGPNAFPWRSTQKPSVWQNVKRLAGVGAPGPVLPTNTTKPLRAEVAPVSADGDMEDAAQLDPYVQLIRAGLDVKLTETSRLINISFTHSDPVAAAKVANVIADTFVVANRDRRADSTSTASEFLKERIDELKTKIEGNERRLLEFAKDHRTYPLDSVREIGSERLATLDKGLIDAENQLKQAEAEYQAALAPGAAAAIVEGNNNPQINSIEGRLADLRQRLSVMLIDSGENWPEVKELRKQVDLLESQLEKAKQNAIRVVLTNLETRYKQALAREQSLRKSFETQHNTTMNENSAGIQFRMIQQETATYRSLLDGLLQRSKENDIIRVATPNNVHVTDYASLPVGPVGPHRFRVIALAFIASLGLGVGLAILLGSFEDAAPVDSVERVEKMFALPTLGVIPAINNHRQLKQIRGLVKRNGNGNGHKNGKSKLLLNGDLRSPLAESYKKLRTSVVLLPAKRTPKSLLVTSSLPAEGKTTSAVNTALVMSLSGGNVLLIDGDLRHPKLHELLDIDNSRGLSTILSEDVSDAEALSMIEQYRDTKLYLLPSGPTPDNPAELLGSARMRQLLASLDSSFSHIIIDSPPISFFTDAVLLSSLVDGVLMVVRGPKTPRQVARYSLQSLDGVGAPILGVVLNAVNVKSHDYTYYRQYYR